MRPRGASAATRAKRTTRRRATTCTTFIRSRKASGSMACPTGDGDADDQTLAPRSGLHADRTADRAGDHRNDADAGLAGVFSFDRCFEGEGARAESARDAYGDRPVLRRPGTLP